MKSIIKQLESYDSFVVTGHDPADADCAGAALALVSILRSLGKKALHVRGEALPRNCQFLPAAEETIVLPKWESQKIDCLIAVDSPDRFRIDNVLGLFEGLPLLVIDHHQSSDIITPHSWVESSRSSASEMVCEIAHDMGVTIDGDMATALFAGIASDTGFFHYPNTGARTMEWAAQLLAAGADSSYIYQQLNCCMSRAELAICTEMVAKVDYRDAIGIALLTREMLRRHKVKSISPQYVHETLLLSGATEVSITLQELEPSFTKVGLRSKGAVDVASIAQTFGGGGHRTAAGYAIKKSHRDALQELVEAIKEQL